MLIGKVCCERIVTICYERRLSINKLCMISGLTQSTLSNLTSGKSLNPTISTLKKICDGLDMSLYEFFDDEMFENLDQEIS